METTPDINFLRYRPLVSIRIAPKKQFREAINQLGAILSGTALIASIAGYGALICGRDVPTALALGTTSSVGLVGVMKTRLKDEE